MAIDPGIFDLAHSKGIAHLEDVNHDGNIDNTDLTLALKAKSGTAAAPAAKAAASK